MLLKKVEFIKAAVWMEVINPDATLAPTDIQRNINVFAILAENERVEITVVAAIVDNIIREIYCAIQNM